SWVAINSCHEGSRRPVRCDTLDAGQARRRCQPAPRRSREGLAAPPLRYGHSVEPPVDQRVARVYRSLSHKLGTGSINMSIRRSVIAVAAAALLVVSVTSPAFAYGKENWQVAFSGTGVNPGTGQAFGFWG